MRGSKQIRIYSADFSTYTDKTISNLNIDQVYQVIFLAGLYIIVQTIPYVSTDLTTWTRSSMTLTAYDVEVLYTPDRGIIIPDYSTAGKIWLVDEWYTLPNYSNAGYKSYLKLYE